MKEILKVNNLIKKFPKAGGEIDDADAISVLKGINFDVEQGELWENPAVERQHF